MCPKWLRLGQENWKPTNSYMIRVNLALVWPPRPWKRGALDLGGRILAFEIFEGSPR